MYLPRWRFSIFYQPITSLVSNQVTAYEALLRWNHPERGYISPVSFIDVAEQTGLIVPIGRWVLESACAWAAGLSGQGADAVTVSVNMSPRARIAEGATVSEFGSLLSTCVTRPQCMICATMVPPSA